MNRQRSLALVAVLAAAASLAVAPATAGAGPAAQVAWGRCPEDVVAQAAPAELQCATVPVPVDHANPGGGEIKIMISRPARPDSAPRELLLLNPGGPGGSGLTLSTLLMARGLPASVTDRYDLIGMDTRGIGHSAKVSCGFTTGGPYFGNIPPYAVDDAAVVQRAGVVREVAAQCAKNDRTGLLRHLTTANMARDLDRIRAALGKEKASYLGYSYGSALGSAYASLFPERTDRVVLDSNIGDTHLDREGMRRFALGMEQTFPDFADWAARRDAAYGLGSTPAQVRQTYLDLAAQLDRRPVDGIDGGLFRLLTFGGLFGRTKYGQTAQTWQGLREGDSKAALRQQAEADLSPADNSMTVFLAVTCNDVNWPEDVGSYRRAVAEDRQRYPLYGAAAANITPCAFWPHEPAEPPVRITQAGPRNVLLVQNQRDVPTPLRGGQLLREKFGDRARLLTVDGSGHGVYTLGDNACALNVTTRYLIEGRLPARDQHCPA